MKQSSRNDKLKTHPKGRGYHFKKEVRGISRKARKGRKGKHVKSVALYKGRKKKNRFALAVLCVFAARLAGLARNSPAVADACGCCKKNGKPAGRVSH